MDKVTLYIQYTEPIKFNGFTIETDSIDFCSLDDCKDYIERKVTRNWLDDYVQKGDNEIPLYAKNQKGDVLWDKNDIDTIKKRKCR